MNQVSALSSSVSSGKKNTKSLSCFCISVPRKVSNLRASSGGWLRSLRVSWLPPAGDWERYNLVLLNLSTVLLNTTIEKDRTEYVIHDIGLIPGRQYEVAVIVESGNLQNAAHCKGRTGQHSYYSVHLNFQNIQGGTILAV